MREAIAAWIEESRERLCQVARRLGLPDRATVSVPVIQFGDDPQNAAASYEDRVVSPFVIHQLDLEVALMKEGEPFFGKGTLALAQRITESFAANVRFFTFGSPATMARHLPGQMDLGDLDDGDMVFFSLLLLDSALRGYLSCLSNLDGAVNNAFRVADELLAFLGGDAWTTLVSVPVAGLITSVRLEVGPVRVRALSPEEGGQLSAGTSDYLHSRPADRRFRRPPQWWNGERHVIEVRCGVSKIEPPNSPPTWKKVILALQLEGFPIAGPGFGFGSQEPDWLTVVFSSTPVDMPRRSMEGPRELTSEGLKRALDLVRRIDDAAVETPVKPEHVALRRFSLGAARPSPNDSIVDNIVALEALLLPGKSRNELKFRFAINGALYLGDTPNERRKLRKQLADLYDLRSRLVHGGGAPADLATMTDGAKDSRTPDIGL